MRRIEFFATNRPFRGTIEVLMLGHMSQESTAAGKPVVFEAIDDALMPEQPTFELRPDEAQQLMDQLWTAGVRPTEVGGPGQLAATQAHLQDMRRMVFQQLPPIQEAPRR